MKDGELDRRWDDAFTDDSLLLPYVVYSEGVESIPWANTTHRRFIEEIKQLSCMRQDRLVIVNEDYVLFFLVLQPRI